MTEEQRDRWLALAADARVKLIPMQAVKPEVVLSKEWYLALCAAITAEAVAVERARPSAGVEMTDEEIDQMSYDIIGQCLDTLTGNDFPSKRKVRVFAHALIAEAAARERERCARWQPIETAPDEGIILVVNVAPTAWKPFVSLANLYGDKMPKRHRENTLKYSTHWMPLPEPPSAAAHRVGEKE